MSLKIALAPDEISLVVHEKPGAGAERRKSIETAVLDAGASIVPPREAEALVWLEVGDPTPLMSLLDSAPSIRWVQLSWAGVDPLVPSGLFDRDLTFTCAKGTYGRETAEHALALILAALRSHVAQARRREWKWIDHPSLHGKAVTIIGAGDTATNLARFLQPFGCEIRVVRRKTEPFAGAIETRTPADLAEVLPKTDVLVLALALTTETRGIIGKAELDLLPRGAVVVNVARGAHIDTDALTECLTSGHLAAAGLDVTDPEPLPASHPLWQLDNVHIASHSADGIDFCTNVLAERVRDNIGRFTSGQPLAGLVDTRAGY